MMENTCLKESRKLAFAIIELLRAEYFSTHKIMIVRMTSYMQGINAAAVFDNSNIPVMIILQAPVVQKVDIATHRINLYPLESAIGFPDTYQLDSYLSGG